MRKQLSNSAAQFMKTAIGDGRSAVDVVRDPDAIAAAMGIKLTAAQRASIQHLNSGAVRDRLETLSPDAKRYMREVVKDGRYLSDWKEKPAEVAQRLGMSVKPGLVTEISGLKISDIVAPHGSPTTMRVGAATVISVAVAVIVASAQLDDEAMPVIDFSKIEKL